MTLEEIATRSGHPRWALRGALREEVDQGRVTVDASGSYALIRERFDAETVDALAALDFG